MSKRPKLRTVGKSIPPCPLHDFPKDFPLTLGKEIIYLLATKNRASLEGSEWEATFANCIGAEWKPSNVGLDDVVLGNTAWGAKTVKASNPARCKQVRLISGRNSIVYSFGERIDASVDPNLPGAQVLQIWNARVTSIREKYQNLRTVALIKSNDLTTVKVFEFDTIRYDPELFYWEWNKSNNLEGFDKDNKQHRFTWQPLGSQFTIKEDVPENSIVIKVKTPPPIEKDKLFDSIGFDPSWITILK
jgi:hypothetical protein